MTATLRQSAIVLLMTGLAAAEPAATAKTQTNSLGWCTVVSPSVVRVNDTATFRVTLSKVPDKVTKVHVDLHWIDSAGVNKGSYVGGGGKDVVLDKPIEWVLKLPAKDGIGKVLPIIYLSSEGTWATKIGDHAKLPTIDVK